jgi:hypothetical protein
MTDDVALRALLLYHSSVLPVSGFLFAVTMQHFAVRSALIMGHRCTSANERVTTVRRPRSPPPPPPPSRRHRRSSRKSPTPDTSACRAITAGCRRMPLGSWSQMLLPLPLTAHVASSRGSRAHVRRASFRNDSCTRNGIIIIDHSPTRRWAVWPTVVPRCARAPRGDDDGDDGGGESETSLLRVECHFRRVADGEPST